MLAGNSSSEEEHVCTLLICLQGQRGAHRLAQAALADAAQARKLEAVRRHQQVLRHRHVQVGAVRVLHSESIDLSMVRGETNDLSRGSDLLQDPRTILRLCASMLKQGDRLNGA